MNNLKFLVRAWTHYAEDHSGNLPASGSYPDDEVAQGIRQPNWVGQNWLDLPASDADNVLPTQGTAPLSNSVLWSYLPGPSVFQCPDDYGLTHHESLGHEAQVQRVRSYSMQCWMGGPGWNFSPGWKTFTKLSDLGVSSPDKTIVFLEERVEAINDGYFVIDMTGFNPFRPGGNRSARIADYPGTNHGGAANIGYVDGSVEPHRWIDSRTAPTRLVFNVTSPSNPDVLWLQSRATVSD